MNLKISRVLHAGYIFEYNESTILFDPLFETPFSRNCYPYPSVRFDIDKIKQLKFSAIFISHFHDDHCSFESLNLIDRDTPIYIYCVYDELFSLVHELGFKYVYKINLNESLFIGAIEIIGRKALDVDVDSIFHIKVAGLNVLNVVDSWIDDETLELLAKTNSWDLILWPFQTMREIEVITPLRSTSSDRQLPDEWIHQLKILKPKYIVPSSCQFIHEDWSWYNQSFFPISYAIFQQEIEKKIPEICVLRMNPSESFILSKNSMKQGQALSWIVPIGKQDVDYQYDPHLKPPPTSLVAQCFKELTQAEAERVYKYCQDDLLLKYRMLSFEEESYFCQERIWKLSIYDHCGGLVSFYYKIKTNSIELIRPVPDTELSWLTEIAISKLYAALENGESLTSMYIRINDIKFSLEIEQIISEVDIVEDPLIRCLFNYSFASYQKSQLERIRSSFNKADI